MFYMSAEKLGRMRGDARTEAISGYKGESLKSIKAKTGRVKWWECGGEKWH